jgi:hypothetical protein
MLNTLRNFGKNLVFVTLAGPLLLLTALGHLADLGTTWYAITFSGARESNPFLAWFVNSNFSGKWFALAGLKAGVVANQARTVFNYKRLDLLKLEVFGCVFVWLVVAWNFSIILRRQYGRTGSKA